MTDIPILDAPTPAPQKPPRTITRRRAGWPKGKARTATQRTAGDAVKAGVAQPPEHPSAAPIRHEQDEKLTRQPRGVRDVGGFDFPAHRRKPGWDYQLIAISVMNQPVSGGELAPFYQQGWRPVPAAEAPELQVPGFQTDTIDVRGMRWFWRPEHLSAQAKREDYDAAQQQQKDRMFGATRGEVKGGAGLADVAGVRPVNLGIEVYGETGTLADRR